MNRSDDSTASPAIEESARPGIVSLIIRILLPVILIVVGAVGYSMLSKSEPAPAPPRPKPKALEARVTELKREDYQILVPSQGMIRAHSQVALTAQVSGRVLIIHPEFEEGAFFKEGDILLELDPIDFEVAVVSAESQLAQAKLALAQERARAEQARLDWKDLGYTEEPSELVRREPQLKAAEQNLKLAEAQRASAQRNLNRAQITAPFDGRVLTRAVGIGQTVGGATPLGEIFATDYSEVRLPVSTRRLADLSLPEDITDPPLDVRLKDGLVEGSALEWEARIHRTEGALDASTLELFAIARIEDPYGLQSEKVPLRVGQPVDAIIPGRILKDVFVIPREAVTSLSRIRLVDPESLKLQSVRIESLWADDDFIVFQNSTIEDGTLLVMTRLVYAPDGGTVVIVEDEIPAEPESAEAVPVKGTEGAANP
jgi:RND family efflux transporter MFP subunit